MDVLSDVLNVLKLSSVVYFKSDFSSPWGMDVQKGPFAQFHIVTRGQCVLNINDQYIQLFAGDIIAFPKGTQHWIADDERSIRYDGKEVVQAIVSGGSLFTNDNVCTTLVCGHFKFDRGVDHPLVKELPEVIHIPDAERRELTRLETMVNLIVEEADSARPGSDVIVNKLGEVLFVHMLRSYILNNKGNKGFMAAIQDRRISEALKAIHNSPQENWQLSQLAQIAGVSRTSFSNQFKALIGDTPLNYITQWRMLQAQELLLESDKPVGEIANEVGYQSEAAFNRVFKKRVNITPLKFRMSNAISPP